MNIAQSEDEEGEIECEVQGTEKKFGGISQLLEYYQKNPLDHEVTAIGETVKRVGGSLQECGVFLCVDSDGAEVSDDEKNEEPNEEGAEELPVEVGMDNFT